MGWMSRLVGKDEDKQQTVKEKQQATAGTISYHKTLIPEYLKAHKELIGIFAKIGDSAKTGDFARTKDLLAEFKTGFDGHLLSENVRFYAYMEELFRGNQENHELVQEFRSEMSGIARSVSKFIRKWRDSGIRPETQDAFLGEYREIGKVLKRRIEAEESSLYPLYQPK